MLTLHNNTSVLESKYEKSCIQNNFKDADTTGSDDDDN